MNKNQAQTQIQDCAKLEVENIQFECCSHTDQFAAFKFSEPRWQISEAPFSTTWQPSGIIVFRQAGPELCWLSHRRNTNRVTLPELPLFIVGTCEQALSKTSIQRSWFSWWRNIFGVEFFFGGGATLHLWLKFCLMRQLSRVGNSSNCSGVYEGQEREQRNAQDVTHTHSFTAQVKKLAPVIAEA